MKMFDRFLGACATNIVAPCSPGHSALSPVMHKILRTMITGTQP